MCNLPPFFSLCLSLSLCPYLSMSLCVCVCVSLCLSVPISLCLSVSVSLSLSISVSLCISLSLSPQSRKMSTVYIDTVYDAVFRLKVYSKKIVNMFSSYGLIIRAPRLAFISAYSLLPGGTLTLYNSSSPLSAIANLVPYETAHVTMADFMEEYRTRFSTRFQGVLKFPWSGNYTFMMTSRRRTVLRLDGVRTQWVVCSKCCTRPRNVLIITLVLRNSLFLIQMIIAANITVQELSPANYMWVSFACLQEVVLDINNLVMQRSQKSYVLEKSK